MKQTAPQGSQVATQEATTPQGVSWWTVPGALAQLDSKHVALGNGKVVYQFGAVDCFTRKRVVALAPRLTSHHGAEFLRQG